MKVSAHSTDARKNRINVNPMSVLRIAMYVVAFGCFFLAWKTYHEIPDKYPENGEGIYVYKGEVGLKTYGKGKGATQFVVFHNATNHKAVTSCAKSSFGRLCVYIRKQEKNESYRPRINMGYVLNRSGGIYPIYIYAPNYVFSTAESKDDYRRRSGYSLFWGYKFQVLLGVSWLSCLVVVFLLNDSANKGRGRI